MKVCAEPGCPELTDSTRCDLHTKAKRRAEDKRRLRDQVYNDPQWRRTRKAFLRANPICQWPEGCIAPATDVHHLDGLGHRGPRGHDVANLQGLCHSHHSKVTARETPAGWNAPL